MRSHPCLLAVLSSLLPLTLHAADTAPAKDDSAPAPYVLKRRSTFTPPIAAARAPFWPIGWTPPKSVASTPTQAAPTHEPALDEKSFRVTSILLGDGSTPSFAVINGRAYGEGEFLKVPRGSGESTQSKLMARIRVERINDGRIMLQRGQQTLLVSLQRPDLALKKIQEEQLLSDDR